MVDKTLAGSGTLGSYTPIDLFAGEQDVVTDRAMVKAGLVLSQFQVIALDGDMTIVAWDPDLTGIGKEYATGTLTFSGTGTAADTITINGVVITLVAAAPDPAAHQALIGVSATATAQNVKALINAYPDAFEVVAKGSAAVLTLRANVPGDDGNAITTTEAGTGTAFGAATLASGVTVQGEAVGILPHALDTSGTGLNKATWSPYYSGGFFNHAALVWPAGAPTLAARKAAFLGTNISIGSVL